MANSGAGSKVDAVVKLVLISSVVILSFSVGTFVGKQVSDADHRRAELEMDYGKPEADRAVASVDDVVPEPNAISDEEIAALREEFEKAEAVSSAAEKPQKEVATQEAKEKDGYKKLGAPAKAAERVAKAMAPAKDVKEKRAPSSALPSVATSAIGKYTVQVASFASENEAREQVEKLKGKGYGAFYVSADVKGQTWFRVSVGLFTDQSSANDYRKEILATREVSSAIVQKIVK